MVRLHLPYDEGDLDRLEVGDEVLIDGVLHVGRDQVHRRLCDMIARGEDGSWDLLHGSESCSPGACDRGSRAHDIGAHGPIQPDAGRAWATPDGRQGTAQPGSRRCLPDPSWSVPVCIRRLWGAVQQPHKVRQDRRLPRAGAGGASGTACRRFPCNLHDRCAGKGVPGMKTKSPRRWPRRGQRRISSI